VAMQLQVPLGTSANLYKNPVHCGIGLLRVTRMDVNDRNCVRVIILNYVTCFLNAVNSLQHIINQIRLGSIIIIIVHRLTPIKQKIFKENLPISVIIDFFSFIFYVIMI
jgi:hypothetical protein